MAVMRVLDAPQPFSHDKYMAILYRSA